MPLFESSVLFSHPQETVFEFLVQPENMVRVSPPEMNLSLLQAPDRLTHGSQFEFQVQAYGQTQKFLHHVTLFEEPHRFIDEQIDGLFKRWSHEHRLDVVGDDVKLIDRIDFQPPGGMLGFVLTESRIRSSLEQAFDHRHREMQRLIGTL